MKAKLLILMVMAVLLVPVLAASASAAPPSSEDLVNKIFGCDGLIAISCPGPVIIDPFGP